jgi:hypothetical protein
LLENTIFIDLFFDVVVVIIVNVYFLKVLFYHFAWKGFKILINDSRLNSIFDCDYLFLVLQQVFSQLHLIFFMRIFVSVNQSLMDKCMDIFINILNSWLTKYLNLKLPKLFYKFIDCFFNKVFSFTWLIFICHFLFAIIIIFIILLFFFWTLCAFIFYFNYLFAFLYILIYAFIQFFILTFIYFFILIYLRAIILYFIFNLLYSFIVELFDL